MKKEKVDESMCDYMNEIRYPFDGSLISLGKKWGAPILLEIFSGKDSFNALLNALPGVNSKTLSARLVDFREAGLIEKNEIPGGPPRTRYQLTKKGEEFRLLARELVGFSLRWHAIGGVSASLPEGSAAPPRDTTVLNFSK